MAWDYANQAADLRLEAHLYISVKQHFVTVIQPNSLLKVKSNQIHNHYICTPGRQEVFWSPNRLCTWLVSQIKVFFKFSVGMGAVLFQNQLQGPVNHLANLRLLRQPPKVSWVKRSFWHLGLVKKWGQGSKPSAFYIPWVLGRGSPNS